jgi:6-phosphogluconolactonase
MDLRIHKDLEGLSLEAAQIFFELVRKKEENGPPFTVALSGGSTPRTLYRILASEPYGKKISWGGVQLFFGDERCVEPKHPDSNYRMVFDTLVSRVDIPGENIHRMEGELEPASAAARYEEYLKKFFGERGLVDEATGMPVFDLVLLGLGDDGHTLSIFPGTKALAEEKRLVKENFVESLLSWRLTLTFPVVNAASTVVFLVSGEAKAKVLKELVTGARGSAPYPAGRVRPVTGRLIWLVDKEAARLLCERK